MVNFQEFLETKKDYFLSRASGWSDNTIDVRDILKELKEIDEDLELDGGELDLSLYPNVFSVRIDGSYLRMPLTKIKLGDWPNLSVLEIQNNQLTSIDFLKDLSSHPEKLVFLNVGYNNINSDLEPLKPFVNLNYCFLGSYLNSEEWISSLDEERGRKFLEKRKDGKTYNQFYGSLEPIKNYTQLEKLCIAGTNIDSGLEYLPLSLVKENKKKVGEYVNVALGYQFNGIEEYLAAHNIIDCQPSKDSDKCKTIYEDLKKFGFVIEAWQLAHPEKMLLARPELFTDFYTKDKWQKALEQNKN